MKPKYSSFSPYICVPQRDIASILEKGYRPGMHTNDFGQKSSASKARLEEEERMRPEYARVGTKPIYGFIAPTNKFNHKAFQNALGHGGRNAYFLKLNSNILKESTLVTKLSWGRFKTKQATIENIAQEFNKSEKNNERYLEFLYWGKERGSLMIDEIHAWNNRLSKDKITISFSLGNEPLESTKEAALNYGIPMYWDKIELFNESEYEQVNNIADIKHQYDLLINENKNIEYPKAIEKEVIGFTDKVSISDLKQKFNLNGIDEKFSEWGKTNSEKVDKVTALAVIIDKKGYNFPKFVATGLIESKFLKTDVEEKRDKVEQSANSETNKKILKTASNFLYYIGAKSFDREDNNYRITSDKKTFLTIEAKDGRGKIFKYNNGSFENKLSEKDVKYFDELDKNIQKLVVQKQQEQKIPVSLTKIIRRKVDNDNSLSL